MTNEQTISGEIINEIPSEVVSEDKVQLETESIIGQIDKTMIE
jgi:hypothetical protein